MDVLSWTFGVTTVIGTALTVFYGRKSAQLELSRKKLDWSDLQSCANDMGATIKKTFAPDVILTPGLRGATFANLLVDELNPRPPVFVGVQSWRDQTNPLTVLGSFLSIETSKWYVHIPECIFAFKGKKILVVDDFAMTGDFLQRIKKELATQGFDGNSIRTACIVTTKVAIHSKKSPDYHWLEVADDSFFFPWGKAK